MDISHHSPKTSNQKFQNKNTKQVVACHLTMQISLYYTNRFFIIRTLLQRQILLFKYLNNKIWTNRKLSIDYRRHTGNFLYCHLWFLSFHMLKSTILVFKLNVCGKRMSSHPLSSMPCQKKIYY